MSCAEVCTCTDRASTHPIMITKILAGFAAVILVFLIVVATRPADFRVERGATLSASPAALFEHVNNHRKFAVWNPFLKLDPNVKNTYSGPSRALARCAVGTVTATWVREAAPSSRANRVSSCAAGWIGNGRWKVPARWTSTFKAQGDQTVVTWAMYGKNNFMGKVMSLFMDCDRICGPQFEKGLADLGAVAVAATAPAK